MPNPNPAEIRQARESSGISESKPPRGGFSPFTIPNPEEVRTLRKRAGLTQTQAATLVCAKLRTWQDWEAGNVKMHPGLWELFNLKC